VQRPKVANRPVLRKIARTQQPKRNVLVQLLGNLAREKTPVA
jgi:hypothetical protein